MNRKSLVGMGRFRELFGRRDCLSIPSWIPLLQMILFFVATSNVVHAEDTVWTVRDIGKVDAKTGKKPSLRGLAAVGSHTAWACGSLGTIVRVDGEKVPIDQFTIPGLEEVEFRSIHAWSPSECIVATAGAPATVWKTTDDGKHWDCVLRSQNEKSFFNGMLFYDDEHGVLFGDPIDGKLEIFFSSDRGRTWQPISPSQLPNMAPNEAGFAASNSSMVIVPADPVAEPQSKDTTNTSKRTQPQSDALRVWIGLGGRQGTARVLQSAPFERSTGLASLTKWSLSEVAPIQSSPSEGIFSLAWHENKLIAVGGDYQVLEKQESNIAICSDQKRDWRRPLETSPSGFRSCVDYDPFSKRWIAVGPTGTDESAEGEKWILLSDVGFHVLDISDEGLVWAAGSNGRVGTMNSTTKK